MHFFLKGIDKSFHAGMIPVDLQAWLIHYVALHFYKKWNVFVLRSHSLNDLNPIS